MNLLSFFVFRLQSYVYPPTHTNVVYTIFAFSLSFFSSHHIYKGHVASAPFLELSQNCWSRVNEPLVVVFLLSDVPLCYNLLQARVTMS